MTDALFSSYVPPRSSRIQGPRKVLAELRRIRNKVAKALEYRPGEFGVNETCWLQALYDELGIRIRVGDMVLPGEDPRVKKTVRKRKIT